MGRLMQVHFHGRAVYGTPRRIMYVYAKACMEGHNRRFIVTRKLCMEGFNGYSMLYVNILHGRSYNGHNLFYVKTLCGRPCENVSEKDPYPPIYRVAY